MSNNPINFNSAGLTTEIRPQFASPLDNSPIRQSSSSGPISYNGNFYELVTVGSNISWENARTQAAGRTHEGRQGYLATITSQGEQELIQGLVNNAGINVWLGGSDAAVEGDWRWVTGPEGLANNGAGTPFWSGGVNGQPVSGSYVNWSSGEPNDANNNNPAESEDYLMMIGSPTLVNQNRVLGSWNDFPNADGVNSFRPQGFIVEYGGLPEDNIPGNGGSGNNGSGNNGSGNNDSGNGNLPISSLKNDLYWRNYNNGENAYWEIVSSTTEGQLSVDIGAANFLNQLSGKEWAMDLVADFNKDGQSDIFFHNYSTGETQVWLLQKNSTSGEVSRIGSAINICTIPEPGWRVVGAADFNKDGVTDIVWRHQNTSKNAVWIMESNGNNSRLAAGFFIDSDAPSEWFIESVADIDNNGKYDFVWRNNNGDLAIWEMTYNSQMNLPTATSNGTPPAIAANATNNPFSRTAAYFLGIRESVDSMLGAVADFTGDGILDFAWHNDKTGVAKIWTLATANNGQISRGLETVLSPNTGANSGWEIVGVGKLNQDTTPDLVWRNYLTGENAAWTINHSAQNGVTFGTGVFFSGIGRVIDTNWVIEAVEASETTATVA